MKAPICAVCYKRFSEVENAGLVSFTLTEEEKLYSQNFKKEGFVGHPKGKEWFCSDHYEAAKALKHLSAKEAIAQIKSDYNVDLKKKQ